MAGGFHDIRSKLMAAAAADPMGSDVTSAPEGEGPMMDSHEPVPGLSDAGNLLKEAGEAARRGEDFWDWAQSVGIYEEGGPFQGPFEDALIREYENASKSRVFMDLTPEEYQGRYGDMEGYPGSGGAMRNRR